MIYWYFGTLIVLAALSHFPVVLFLASVLGVPALLLVASNTVLLYSVLLLPFFIWPRQLYVRPLLAFVALLPALIVAFGVPTVSQWRSNAFAAEQMRDDFDRATPIPKIRTLTIAGPRAAALSCGDTCERLLYNRDVDKVIMARWSGAQPDKLPEATAWRVERRPPCAITPATPGPSSMDAKRRFEAGECVLPEINADAENVDATVAQWPAYMSTPSWADPRSLLDRALFTLHAIERVSLAAGGARNGQPVMLRTIVSASALAMPLRFRMGGEAFSPTIVPSRTEAAYVGNATENVLRGKLGLKLAPVANP
ncbi:MAG TPA: hypothetical protein VM867_13470 [Xanthobacteraceae bacterium]|jgi:hypothetical protein|nr:hypothetical protein [Xanthobacteraceae bacterium]